MRECFRCRILLEQSRGHNVHAHVRTLRGEDRRDQQLKRVFVIQFANRVRIGLIQFLQDCRDAFWLGFDAKHCLRGNFLCFWLGGFFLFSGHSSKTITRQAGPPANGGTPFLDDCVDFFLPP